MIDPFGPREDRAATGHGTPPTEGVVPLGSLWPAHDGMRGGGEALPDLITMDVMMAKKDGAGDDGSGLRDPINHANGVS